MTFKKFSIRHGLKVAAILAYEQLRQPLEPFGYLAMPHSPGMWYHTTRKTRFCLCVDDFAVKYHSKEDADHLLSKLRKWYGVSIDWDGKNYCGLELNWNYTKKIC